MGLEFGTVNYRTHCVRRNLYPGFMRAIQSVNIEFEFRTFPPTSDTTFTMRFAVAIAEGIVLDQYGE